MSGIMIFKRRFARIVGTTSSIGVKGACILDDASDSSGGSCSCIPVFRSQKGKNSGQEIEEFIRMLFLNVSELLCSSVPY